MAERILTLHPEGKQGVNIHRSLYDPMKNAMLDELEVSGEITFSQLLERLKIRLAGTFPKSVSWYGTTVKLDLEARGLLHCTRGKGPQKIRLAGGK